MLSTQMDDWVSKGYLSCSSIFLCLLYMCLFLYVLIEGLAVKGVKLFGIIFLRLHLYFFGMFVIEEPSKGLGC